MDLNQKLNELVARRNEALKSQPSAEETETSTNPRFELLKSNLVEAVKFCREKLTELKTGDDILISYQKGHPSLIHVKVFPRGYPYQTFWDDAPGLTIQCFEEKNTALIITKSWFGSGRTNETKDMTDMSDDSFGYEFADALESIFERHHQELKKDQESLKASL